MTPPTLKQLIEKATPGPWSVKSTDEGRAYTKNWREISPGVVSASSYTTNRYGETEEIPGVSISEANAQLIARCSPAVMLAVVEILEDLSGYVRASTYPDGPCLKSEDLSEVNRVLNLLNGKAP